MAELSLPLMEYLTGRRDEDNNLIAFASYMRTTEDDLSGRARPVLYIYELQVVEGERGRGLGSSLLRRLEDIAINSDLPIMLTCFKANVDAMRFYTKAGYSIDEISPSRCGYHDYDYEILIKQVIHQTGATH